jgi:hypothetical protein
MGTEKIAITIAGGVLGKLDGFGFVQGLSEQKQGYSENHQRKALQG